MFHATMVVTRTEEWCVEAETPEEARRFWKLAAATAVIQGTGFIMKLNSGVLLEAKPWARGSRGKVCSWN